MEHGAAGPRGWLHGRLRGSRRARRRRRAGGAGRPGGSRAHPRAERRPFRARRSPRFTPASIPARSWWGLRPKRPASRWSATSSRRHRRWPTSPAGTVLVEEHTWRRTRMRSATDDGARTSPRGSPSRPWRRGTERLAPRSRRGERLPLVGAEFVDRRSHLERLSAEFRAVRKDRRARVVIVSGEAGAGKTRLASEFISGIPTPWSSPGRSTCIRHAGRLYRRWPAPSASIAGIAPDVGDTIRRRRIQALAERVATGDRCDVV